jgi:gamma-glutamylcyclotransferase (GGCT)/AIG2-like uncharacterized protein YtfP
MLYFAYGSNMNWGQIRERCPSACFVGMAVLPDHQLAFTRESRKRQCGVADAVRGDGRKLWGVVYEIDDRDLPRLDDCEGYEPGRSRNAYCRRECVVSLDGDEKRPLTVLAYFADRQANPPLPNAEYKELILSGARYWHLPEDYIGELEQIEVSG